MYVYMKRLDKTNLRSFVCSLFPKVTFWIFIILLYFSAMEQADTGFGGGAS